MTLTLTIVRHGDTFAPGEVPRRIGARTDLPLAVSGQAQARALGMALADEGVRVDRLFAAPLRRTRETAALLARMLGDPPAVETADWLAEIDHGPDENLPDDAVLARIGPAALAAWNEDLVAPPGWTVDASARLAAWRGVLERGRGHYLMVTSNGAARFALQADARLAGQLPALASRKLRTGAWGRLVVADGAIRIVAWDRRPGERAAS